MSPPWAAYPRMCGEKAEGKRKDLTPVTLISLVSVLRLTPRSFATRR